MASLCHPWFTTTNLSYRFPILNFRHRLVRYYWYRSLFNIGSQPYRFDKGTYDQYSVIVKLQEVNDVLEITWNNHLPMLSPCVWLVGNVPRRWFRALTGALLSSRHQRGCVWKCWFTFRGIWYVFMGIYMHFNMVFRCLKVGSETDHIAFC